MKRCWTDGKLRITNGRDFAKLAAVHFCFYIRFERSAGLWRRRSKQDNTFRDRLQTLVIIIDSQMVEELSRPHLRQFHTLRLVIPEPAEQPEEGFLPRAASPTLESLPSALNQVAYRCCSLA